MSRSPIVTQRVAALHQLEVGAAVRRARGAHQMDARWGSGARHATSPLALRQWLMRQMSSLVRRRQAAAAGSVLASILAAYPFAESRDGAV
jgi:hypothetical protein